MLQAEAERAATAGTGMAGTASRTVAVSGSHPLLAAASKNQLSTVQKLLARGGSLDVVEETMGHSAIHMAANRGHTGVVRCLLGAKMSPNGTDYRGYTPNLTLTLTLTQRDQLPRIHATRGGVLHGAKRSGSSTA